MILEDIIRYKGGLSISAETSVDMTRSQKQARISKKKKTIVLIAIIAVLGIVLGVGGNFVLAYLAEDAATSEVDKAAELAEELSTQEDIDAAQDVWDAALELVEDLKEGTVQDTLTQRLTEIQKSIDEAQEALDIANARTAAEEAATAAVESVQASLDQLTTQELIDTAHAEYQSAYTMVEELHEGTVKDSLFEQMEEVENSLEEVQKLFDAVEFAKASVAEVESLLADLSSQGLVDKAQAAHETATEIVEELHDDDIKEQLQEQLVEFTEAIDQAQEELHRKAEAAATEAVEKAEAQIDGLSSQGAINSANSAYRPANNLVNNLHSGEVKDSLATRIKAVKSAIDQAQSQLDSRWAKVRLNFNRQRYTYSNLAQDVQKLVGHYPDLAKSSVLGKSVEGRNIWSITIGKGSKNIVILGSVHASEWISTPVLMRTVETLLWDYDQEIYVNGESVKSILDQYSITFIPMVNPDGATLVQQGVGAYPQREDELLALNEAHGDDFSRWKANIRGVDLNRNFDVRWGTQPGQSENPDPNYAWYPGPAAESEPETRAVANWVRNNNPKLLLDYHSFGEILFWWYFQSGSKLTTDQTIVSAMRSYSGYRMESINYNSDPSATSTYWGSRVIGIPSITVELGNRSPRLLGMGDLSSIFNKVRYMPVIAIQNLPGH